MNQQQILAIFQQGGVVVFPTDTVFGIGCRIDQPRAVDRVYQIKQRSPTKPVPILVASIEMALTYFDQPSDIVRHLMNQYWPGALTIIAPAKKKLIGSPITGKGTSVGIRWPNLNWLTEIIALLGVPIIGTSANISGKAAVNKYQHLDPEVTSQVDLVVPGKWRLGTVSTVVECSGEKCKIVRQGSVQVTEIKSKQSL